MEVVIVLGSIHTIAMPGSLQERHNKGIETSRNACKSCIAAVTLPPRSLVELVQFEALLCPTSLDNQIMKRGTTFVVKTSELPHEVPFRDASLGHGVMCLEMGPTR